ncbi:MAG: type II secretion system protein [Elusimicrobiota bacterium]
MLNKKNGKANKGFTLIELMIVVAIIGILAAIAIPKFADLIRKSNEGATRGNLGAVRSALSIYYGDMEGQYPDDPGALTLNQKYLRAIPTAKMPPYHTDSNAVSLTSSQTVDGSGWGYNNVSTSDALGTIWTKCTHTDTKSKNWSEY